MGEAKLVFLSFETKYLTSKIGPYITYQPAPPTSSVKNPYNYLIDVGNYNSD